MPAKNNSDKYFSLPNITEGFPKCLETNFPYLKII